MSFAIALLLFCTPAGAQEPALTPHSSNAHPILPIGSPAPDFALPRIDGRIHRLADYNQSPLLMVMSDLIAQAECPDCFSDRC
jgi:hypothetical protein